LKNVVIDVISEKCSKAVLKKYVVSPNDADIIEREFVGMLNECDVIVASGGTGLSKKDITVEVLSKYATKIIPGFGEAFRYISWKEEGVRALLSRAFAFSRDRTLVFVVPGNPKAVKLALEELICEMAPHALYELRR